MPILAHGYVKQEMEWNEVNNEDENHICNELVLFLGVYSDFYAKDILEEEALAELEGMIE